MNVRCLGFAGLALLATVAHAQFDPARMLREPPAVAARFPDPDVRYATPSLREGRADFASHAEVLAFLEGLARESRHLKVETIGTSQRGLVVPLAVLAANGRFEPSRPTVMIIGQQHGNEPAGGEAALAIAQQFAGPKAALLERVNVLVIPRGNPDGAERFARVTPNGIDVNRDHLLLRTPEARAIAAATLKYQPQVVLDLHEFTVAGRWVDKFAAMQKYDALVQAATVGNLDPAIEASAREYVDRLHAAWAAQNLTSFAYHTATPDPRDKTVSMGGVQPDTGRNVSGLRPSISLLIEVRGVGLGRAHLLRRVHAHVVAANTVIETAAGQDRRLLQLVRQAETQTQAQACRGELVVVARHSAGRQRMVFVDAVSGADMPLEVDWRSATPFEVVRARPRPCGYLLAPTQADAVERLRLLGVRMLPVAQASRWDVERYVVTAESGGQRQDVRGAIDDADEKIRVLQVSTQRASEVVAPGTLYLPLDQPLAPVIAAAMEPDSQSSYAANRLLDLENSGLRRVISRPAPPLLERR